MTRAETDIDLPLVEAYDRWSDFYDTYDNPMVFGADCVVRELAAATRGGTVVEFGCGTGRNLERLREAGARRLVGCDLSSGMLERARARCPAFELFRQDMAEPLPLPDASADLVLFCLTLEHVADPVTPLREARRLVRGDGTVMVVEIHPFLSMGNVAAHFRDGDSIIRMPTVAHSFADHLNAQTMAGLVPGRVTEWRPRDFGKWGPVPEKVLKRGPDIPLLVQFRLRPRD
ncbi:MAG: methyltransferase domain-containing protein [Telmatospirillum sp.]|nr:methyltransferase domain-containing protein [Telmatospirillum sp.]